MRRIRTAMKMLVLDAFAAKLGTQTPLDSTMTT
jgi:hypothetical protein